MKKMSDEHFIEAALALRHAVQSVGGYTNLSNVVGVSVQAVSAWTVCPPMHVRKVSEATGIKMCKLRPDLYGGE